MRLRTTAVLLVAASLVAGCASRPDGEARSGGLCAQPAPSTLGTGPQNSESALVSFAGHALITGICLATR